MKHFDFFGDGAELHHVGMAVESVADLCPTCELVVEEGQGVSYAFIDVHGARIELLEPLGEDSPILASLRKGVKLLHLCFEVPDLDVALEVSKRSGFHRIRKVARASSLEDRRLAWVFSPEFGLFELLEK